MNILRDLLIIGRALFVIKFFRKRMPIAVRWNITNRCLYQCPFCYVDRENQQQELSTKAIKYVINQMAQTVRCISFSGGEPLLRKDMGEIIDYCYRKQIRVELNTTGYQAVQRIKELKKVARLKLSLEGRGFIHDKLRGQGTFRQVMDVVDAAKRNGIRLAFMVTLMEDNLGEIGFLIKLSRRLNIPISFQPLYDDELNRKIREFYPDVRGYRKAIDEIIAFKKQKSFLIRNSFAELKVIRLWPNYPPYRCAAGKLFCVVMPNGDVLPCDRIKLKAPMPNVLNLGFKKAIAHMAEPSCNSCGYIGSMSLSYLLNFDPRIMVSLWRWR